MFGYAASRGLEEYIDELKKEREELRAATEKLVEALDSCMWVDNERGAVTGIARKALAEYREKFPKEVK
mgnify:CR=1 FL=1